MTHDEYEAMPVDTIDGLLTILDTVTDLEIERLRNGRDNQDNARR